MRVTLPLQPIRDLGHATLRHATPRYANWAKNISNDARVNIDPGARVISGLKSQVVSLAAEILRMRHAAGTFGDDDDGGGFPFSEGFLDDLIDTCGGAVSGGPAGPSVLLGGNETVKHAVPDDTPVRNVSPIRSVQFLSTRSVDSFMSAKSEQSYDFLKEDTESVLEPPNGA